VTSIPSIDLQVYEQLEDRDFRQAFFVAETSGLIARQLIACRERREMNQSELADEADTYQPIISRVEGADYRSWSFKTLLKLANALDARLRVLIEPWEDVREEYREPAEPQDGSPETSVLSAMAPRETQPTLEGKNYGIGQRRDEQGVLSIAAGAAQRATISAARRSWTGEALLLP
jgi:transcriptional regulator with XRE-family HTH domain